MVSVDKPKPMRYAVLEIIQANRRGITPKASGRRSDWAAELED